MAVSILLNKYIGGFDFSHGSDQSILQQLIVKSSSYFYFSHGSDPSILQQLIVKSSSYLIRIATPDRSFPPTWPLIFCCRHEELRAIQNVAYKFQNEAMPDELLEDIVEEMMEDLPPQRLLDGSTLIFNFYGAAVKNIMDNFLNPDNARIDMMSSTLVSPSRSAPPAMENATLVGQAETEPRFEAIYWSETISADLIERWCKFSKPQLPPTTSSLRLPPINPYIPKNWAQAVTIRWRRSLSLSSTLFLEGLYRYWNKNGKIDLLMGK